MARERRQLDVEECWTLVGTRKRPIWYARRICYRSGAPATVTADGAWTLRREEKQHDVLGFLHTHPMGGTRPSSRDLRTMRAWCDALGKPLICLIATPDELAGYRFDDYRSSGVPLAAVETFGLSIVIGVDNTNGRKVPSRADLPRRRGAGQAR